MNLLFMANNGLPRNGLVALYDPYRDTYGRNILPAGSENFVTGWAASDGSAVTVTPNQPDPVGGNNACRIQSVGGNASTKYRMTLPQPITTGVNAKFKIRVKVNAGSCKFVAIGINSAVVNSTEWSESNINITGVTGSNIYLSTNTVSDNLDILVYQPQVNLGTLYPYSPPAGLPQSAVDYTGHANNAQLGSTAGADTNDPAWNGGLVFGTDDYAKSSSPVFDDMSAFTCITVCKPLSAGGLSVGRIFDKTGRIFRYENIGVAFYQLRGGAFIQWTTGAVNFGNNVIYSVAYNGASPDLTPIININTIKQTLTKSGTGTGGCTSDASADLFIGNRSAADRNFDGTIYLQVWYNRILSDTEYMQAYNYLKRLMSSRGITI